MPSRASATRYARALFDVALKESDPVRIGRDLASFADLMSSNVELHGALTNPAVPAAAKRQIADTLATRLSIAAPAHKLLVLLADRDRLGVVPDLLAVYRERLMEHQQVVRAEVTTAAPLTADRAAQLQKQLADITGRTVDMTTSVDPSIIGGVVTRIGGTVYDGSIATQLAKLRQTLAERA
jgi:F-type H+-transporting ATPase subunit delta